MHLPSMVPGQFVQRDNRFRASVTADGATTTARIASSGRMAELLVPGAPVWLAPADRPGRKTAYDLLLVQHEGLLVSVDAHLPNRLWAEYLHDQGWQGQPVPRVDAECRYGSSRLDYCLSGPEGRTWMEIKSVTLVRGGFALFPDAPTTRGTRHVQELERALAAGDRAAVIFVVQRSDASAFAPHVSADPAFAGALVAAHHRGVTVQAYACDVSLANVSIVRALPVILDPKTALAVGAGPAEKATR